MKSKNNRIKFEYDLITGFLIPDEVPDHVGQLGWNAANPTVFVDGEVKVIAYQSDISGAYIALDGSSVPTTGQVQFGSDTIYNESLILGQADLDGAFQYDPTNGFFKDKANFKQLDLANRTAYNESGSDVFSWRGSELKVVNSILFDGAAGYYWDGSNIGNSASGDVISIGAKRLLTGGTISIDWINRTGNDPTGAQVFSWQTGEFILNGDAVSLLGAVTLQQLNAATAGAGSGTVTSVSAGTGMSFTTITTTGAVSLDVSKVPYLSGGFSTGFLKYNGSTFVFDNNTYITGNQNISVTGDASGSGTTAITLTLATVNGNIGTFNNLTVNAKGLVTAASNVSYLTGNQTITLSGDISGSGATAITTAIGAGKVTNAMLAGSIDLTTKVTGVLPVTNGGTGLSSLGTAGQMLRVNTGATALEYFTTPNFWSIAGQAIGASTGKIGTTDAFTWDAISTNGTVVRFAGVASSAVFLTVTSATAGNSVTLQSNNGMQITAATALMMNSSTSISLTASGGMSMAYNNTLAIGGAGNSAFQFTGGVNNVASNVNSFNLISANSGGTATGIHNVVRVTGTLNNANAGASYRPFIFDPTITAFAGAISVFYLPTGLTAAANRLFFDNRSAWASYTAGDVQIADANLIFGTTTGTKIGTAAAQKLAFYGITPIVQPATGGAGVTYVDSGSSIIHTLSTFDGYTLSQVVKALRNLGILA